MVRGFYSAGTGLLTNSRKLDIAGNNISNTRTPGYKKDEAIASTFNQKLVEKIDKLAEQTNTPLGNITSGQTIASVYTNLSQGTLEFTGSYYNIGIAGEGFFSVMGNDNVVRYTRNGELGLDAEGYIVSANGGRLMGENGPINTGGSLFEIAEDGSVYANGNVIDRLAIYNPIDKTNMVKINEGMFVDMGTGEQQEFAGKLQQGYVEMSNVDMVDQMMEMMSSQRGFQSCSQILKMIDQANEKAVQLGRNG